MSRNVGLVVTELIAFLLAAIIWLARHRPGVFARGGEQRSLHEVVDMTSRTVRIPKRPARILSLCTSAADTIVAVGAADRLIAIDEFSRVVPGTDERQSLARAAPSPANKWLRSVSIWPSSGGIRMMLPRCWKTSRFPWCASAADEPPNYPP